MKATLFVIDDDEMFQKIISLTLVKFKSFENIVHFNDASQPLEYLAANKLNAENLPDELVKIYHLLPKKIWVYVVTTSVNRFDRLRAENYDFVKEFISKPVYGE